MGMLYLPWKGCLDAISYSNRFCSRSDLGTWEPEEL